MLPSLHFLFRVLAKDARRADQEHENQDGESRGIAERRRNEAGDECLDDAEDQAADYSPGRMPIPPSTAATKALRPGMMPIRGSMEL